MISSLISPVPIKGLYFSNLFCSSTTVSLKVENTTTLSPFPTISSTKSQALSILAEGIFSVVKMEGHAVACLSLINKANMEAVLSFTLSTCSLTPFLMFS